MRSHLHPARFMCVFDLKKMIRLFNMSDLVNCFLNKDLFLLEGKQWGKREEEESASCLLLVHVFHISCSPPPCATAVHSFGLSQNSFCSLFLLSVWAFDVSF